jgi:hypothetical protein
MKQVFTLFTAAKEIKSFLINPKSPFSSFPSEKETYDINFI